MRFFNFLVLVNFTFLNSSFASGSEGSSRDELVKRFQELKQKLFDEFATGKESDSLMNDFFSNSDTLMKDIDDNLFKSFGFGADLSSNLFKSRWQDDVGGRSFLITPQKGAELNIKVEKGLISIDATEKTAQGLSSSRVSLSVDQDLDSEKYKITKKGSDIQIFFPYGKNALSIEKSSTPPPPAQMPKPSLPGTKKIKEEDMVPIVPRDDYDVI